MAYGSPCLRDASRRVGLPIRIALVVLAIAAAHVGASAQGSPTRALWIAASAVTSPAAIRRAISSAASSGFEAVIAPLSVGAIEDPDRLAREAELVRHARESGLDVLLSIPVNVAAAVGELPASREHVIYQHPEWLMVPRQLAPEMLEIDARSPAYLGRITRWTRANADRVDGLYVSPLDPAAAAYLVTSVVAAARRYAADGVFLDAIDFPGADFDYSRHAMQLFRAKMRATLTLVERLRLDQIEAIDPFAYAEEFPDQWRAFRESALTQLVERLRDALAAAVPSLPVAVGARADAGSSRREYFQDWRAWLDRGLVGRIGHRSRSTGTVLFSTDGPIAPEPAAVPSAQSAGAGGPR